MQSISESSSRSVEGPTAGVAGNRSPLALAAAVACSVLAPIQSVIWHGAAAPGWLVWLLPVLGDPETFVAAASVDQPGPRYFAWGRLLWGVYLALLTTSARLPLGGPAWLRRGMRAALGVAFFGDVLAYGASQWFGPGLRALGFWRIEVPALALALALATLAGILGLRQHRDDRASDAILALALPLAALALAIVRYMPHGLLLPLVWAYALRAQTGPLPRRTGAGTFRRAARVAGLGAIGVVAAAAVSLPYRPILIDGPEVRPAPLTLPAPLPELRLHVFNTGANRMSALLVGDDAPWRAVPAFVIEHPRAGLVVFDCGLSPEVAEHGEAVLPPPLRWLMESRGRPGLTLDDQMRAADLAPADVRWAIVSHLHADHLGAAAAFANATFLAGPGTREEALFGAHSPFARDRQPEWTEIDFDDRSRPVGPFERSIDWLGDGSILVIAAGGHTREDVMALVNLPGGPVLLAGDAVVHRDWLAAQDVERIASDPERAAALRNRVRAFLGTKGVSLLPGHDLRDLGPSRSDIVRHRPELFAVSAWPIERNGR